MQLSDGRSTLPIGVRITPLTTHTDDRGRFTELFRNEWDTAIEPIQWNAVRSEAGALRGVHVHPSHVDYLVVLEGTMHLAFVDLRAGADPRPSVVELRGDDLRAATIPTGVAHGFFFTVPSLHLYAVDRYWDPGDELACRWDDPDLGIPWPRDPGQPLLSERDAHAGNMRDLVAELRRLGL
jgi:dTDP-4-dehydrorhamnose 3,5-epimerase